MKLPNRMTCDFLFGISLIMSLLWVDNYKQAVTLEESQPEIVLAENH